MSEGALGVDVHQGLLLGNDRLDPDLYLLFYEHMFSKITGFVENL